MRPLLVLSYGFSIFLQGKKAVLGIIRVSKQLFWTDKSGKGIENFIFYTL